MTGRITKEEVLSLIPKRRDDTSKYDYGRLLAVCGSAYYRGAAYLSVAGALRCGVGIATLASIEKVAAAVAPSLPECTFLPLNESENGTVSPTEVRRILEWARRADTLLMGCGLAIDDGTRALVRSIVAEADCRLVLDADALNVLSESPELLKGAKKPPVITPHAGEMARLCKKTRKEVEDAPIVTVLRFAEEYGCTVVLKGHITYVASPDGRLAVNDKTGNPGLARGGSGDVLAGMIAGLCARGLDPFDGARCGVYLHGEAADRCAERLSEETMLPSDILTDLCGLFFDNV